LVQAASAASFSRIPGIVLVLVLVIGFFCSIKALAVMKNYYANAYLNCGAGCQPASFSRVPGIVLVLVIGFLCKPIP